MSSVMERLLSMWKERLKALRLPRLRLPMLREWRGVCCDRGEEEAVVVEFDGVSLVDQQDDELDLAKRDGVSAG